MLPVEGLHNKVRYNKDGEEDEKGTYSRHHRINSRKMSLARGTSIDTLPRKIATVAHAHVV